MKVSFNNSVPYHKKSAIDQEKYIKYEIANELAHYITEKFIDVEMDILHGHPAGSIMRYSATIHILTEKKYEEIINHLQKALKCLRTFEKQPSEQFIIALANLINN